MLGSMERGLQTVLVIGQVVVELSTQLVLAIRNAMRRRRRQTVIINALVQDIRQRRRPPYMWERMRQHDFWSVVVGQHFTTNLWLTHFRMSKATFGMLCDVIGPFVAPLPGPGRCAIPTDKRIAIALYKLATCAEYRVVGEVFGVSKTSVHRCLYAVCRAIQANMMKEFIRLPDVAEAQQIAHRNSTRHLVPQVYASVDGTHIPVLPPSDGYRDYVNRKGWPSIILQAVVDDRYQIRDICVGAPGSAHDAAVFTISNLYRFPERHPQASAEVEGVQVPLLIAGDPAYPLLPWLVKGFSGPYLTEEQEAFNSHLSAVRVKVEHTFGHLKGRFRILARRSDVHHTFMPTVVVACCVLHNLCEREKQKRPSDQEPPGNPFPQPGNQHCTDQPIRQAQEIRDALVRHVANLR